MGSYGVNRYYVLLAGYDHEHSETWRQAEHANEIPGGVILDVKGEPGAAATYVMKTEDMAWYVPGAFRTQTGADVSTAGASGHAEVVGTPLQIAPQVSQHVRKRGRARGGGAPVAHNVHGPVCGMGRGQGDAVRRPDPNLPPKLAPSSPRPHSVVSLRRRLSFLCVVSLRRRLSFGYRYVVRQRSPWKAALDLGDLRTYAEFAEFVTQIAVVTATSHARA